MRWLAIIALLLSFAVGVPGFVQAMDIAHADEFSAGDSSTKDAPGKTASPGHVSCGHSHLMDRAQHAQAASPSACGSARFPIGPPPAFDPSAPNPPAKPHHETAPGRERE